MHMILEVRRSTPDRIIFSGSPRCFAHSKTRYFFQALIWFLKVSEPFGRDFVQSSPSPFASKLKQSFCCALRLRSKWQFRPWDISTRKLFPGFRGARLGAGFESHMALTFCTCQSPPLMIYIYSEASPSDENQEKFSDARPERPFSGS